MAGTTNGINVMNSISGRSLGRRSRIQYAVGTINTRLTRMVSTAMLSENSMVCLNCGSASTRW